MTLMVGTRLRPVLGLVVALTLALAGTAAPAGAPSADAALPAWKGGINLYRNGVFTTQKTWLWCTAAGVQIVRNIVDRQTDHSTAGQRRYFNWMRQHNKYDLPESAGVDPQGWTAGLRHFVDDRYRLVASKSFDSALRSAVTNLRRTNLPVALTVSHGNHGWILTGFTATADPAATSRFKVTSVRVTGPLYGRQSKNGYDMKPNTKLTPAQLKGFFTAWRYRPKKMIWDGLFVSIQPVPAKVAAAPTLMPKPAAPSVAAVLPAVSASPPPLATPGASPAASPLAASPSPVAIALTEPVPSPTPRPIQDSPAASPAPFVPGVLAALAVLVLVALVAGTARDPVRPRPSLLASRARATPRRPGPAGRG